LILCIGDKEIEKKEFVVKNLKTGEEISLKESEIAAFVLGAE